MQAVLTGRGENDNAKSDVPLEGRRTTQIIGRAKICCCFFVLFLGGAHLHLGSNKGQYTYHSLALSDVYTCLKLTSSETLRLCLLAFTFEEGHCSKKPIFLLLLSWNIFGRINAHLPVRVRRPGINMHNPFPWFQDIMKFMALFSLVIMAFMVGLHNLFWYYSERNNIEIQYPGRMPAEGVKAEKAFGGWVQRHAETALFFFFFRLMSTINCLIILPLFGGSGRRKKGGCAWVFLVAFFVRKCPECLLSLCRLTGHSGPLWWLGRMTPDYVVLQRICVSCLECPRYSPPECCRHSVFILSHRSAKWSRCSLQGVSDIHCCNCLISVLNDRNVLFRILATFSVLIVSLVC